MLKKNTYGNKNQLCTIHVCELLKRVINKERKKDIVSIYVERSMDGIFHGNRRTRFERNSK